MQRMQGRKWIDWNTPFLGAAATFGLSRAGILMITSEVECTAPSVSLFCIAFLDVGTIVPLW